MKTENLILYKSQKYSTIRIETWWLPERYKLKVEAVEKKRSIGLEMKWIKQQMEIERNKCNIQQKDGTVIWNVCARNTVTKERAISKLEWQRTMHERKE